MYNERTCSDVVVDVEQMIPPVPSAGLFHVKDQTPIRSVGNVNNQSGEESQNDGVHWRQSKVSVDVEKWDIEPSFLTVQFA